MKPENVFLASMAVRAAENSSDDVRRIVGTASTGDAVRDGFRIDLKSMADAVTVAAKRNLKMFWNHGWHIPIGRKESIDFSNNEMQFSGIIGRGFPVPVVSGFSAVLMSVDDLWNIIKQDLTTSLSIAFSADVEEGERMADGKRGPGTLFLSDIFEVSVATIPMDPGAEFKVKRAFDDEMFMLSHARKGPASRQQLWGLGLDGSAAAAAVDGEESQTIDRDPMEILVEERSTFDWDQVREEVRACRQ